KLIFSCALCLLVLPAIAQDKGAQPDAKEQGQAAQSPTASQQTGNPQLPQAAPAPAFSAGEEIETRGMIVSREGENVIIDTAKYGKLTAVLTDKTKVQVPKGIFRHSDMEQTSLLPGLDVELKGTGGDNGQVLAESIRFDRDALRVAQQINAGTAVTRG